MRYRTNNLGDILWHDEIGRMFCVKHRREECNQCYVDYSPMNRQVEIDLGIRKPLSEIQTLAEQHTMCVNGIKFLRQNMSHANTVCHMQWMRILPSIWSIYKR